MTTGHLHSSILEMNRFFKEIEATRSCLFENVICSAAWDLVWQGTWALWRLTNCSPVICVHCSPNPPNRHQRSSPKGWQWQSLVSSSSISRCWCFGEWNNLINTPWLKGPSSSKLVPVTTLYLPALWKQIPIVPPFSSDLPNRFECESDTGPG